SSTLSSGEIESINLLQGGRISTQEGTKALVVWIDEVMVAAGDLHLLRDGPANDSEEESPADDSNVVGGYIVDNEAGLQQR
ncbi:hypothetical protein Tco_0117334, partial [Tanacetum coccineum]